MKLASKLLAILLAALLAIGVGVPAMAEEGETEDTAAFAEIIAQEEEAEDPPTLPGIINLALKLFFDILKLLGISVDNAIKWFAEHPVLSGALSGLIGGAVIGEAGVLATIFLTPFGAANFIIVALLLVSIVGIPVLFLYNTVLYVGAPVLGGTIGALVGVIGGLITMLIDK